MRSATFLNSRMPGGKYLTSDLPQAQQAADKLFDEILAGKEIVSINDLHQVMEETRTW